MKEGKLRKRKTENLFVQCHVRFYSSDSFSFQCTLKDSRVVPNKSVASTPAYLTLLQSVVRGVRNERKEWFHLVIGQTHHDSALPAYP